MLFGRFYTRALLRVATLLLLGGCSSDPTDDPVALTIAFSQSPLTFSQGSLATVEVSVHRGAGPGAVALAIEGLPEGVTGELRNVVQGATLAQAELRLVSGEASFPGNFSLVTRATTEDGTTAAATLPVVITPTVGLGNAAIDFSACAAIDAPLWIAVQDGNGAWQIPVAGVVTPGVARFNVASADGKIAWVTRGGTLSDFNLQVEHRTRAELSAAPLSICRPRGEMTVYGLLNNAFSYWLTLGGVTNSGSAYGNDNHSLTFQRVPDGLADLVAFSGGQNLGGPVPRRAIIRRGIPLPFVNLGTIDVTGPESFAAESAPVSITNLGDEIPRTELAYYTTSAAASCARAPLGGEGGLEVYGIPAARQLAGDFHELKVIGYQQGLVGSAGLGSRATTLRFHALAPKVVTLPPHLPAFVATAVPGPYLRATVSFAVPAEYSRVRLQYFASGGTRVVAYLSSSMAVFPGRTVSMTTPDFSGVPGWNPTWAPDPGSIGSWTAVAEGPDASPCTEGGVLLSATRTGVK